MDITKFFQSQPSETLNELQDEPVRKCRKVNNTQIEESTDDDLSEPVDEESVNSDSEKESEDILSEPAAPISSAHANNDVPQPKTLKQYTFPKDISRSPDDGPMQSGLNCLFNFPKSHGRRFVPEWYKKYP